MLLIVLILGLTLLVSCFSSILVIDSKRTINSYKKFKRMCIIAIVIILIDIIAIKAVPNMTYEEKAQIQRYDKIELIDYYIAGEKEMYTIFFSNGNKRIKIEDSYYIVPNTKICNIDAQNTTVYEQDIDKSYVIAYVVYTKNKLGDMWQDILLWGFLNDSGTTEKKVYEIYVPIGESQYIYQNEQNQS